MCTSDAIKCPCHWKDIHMPKLYSIEGVTLDDREKIVRKVHYTWSWREAMEWVACYPLDWKVAVKRMGRVVALRGVS